MKPNNNLNHFQQFLFHTILPPLHQYNLFWSYKNGRQNRPSGAEPGFFDGRAPQLSARVNQGTTAAGVSAI